MLSDLPWPSYRLLLSSKLSTPSLAWSRAPYPQPLYRCIVACSSYGASPRSTNRCVGISHTHTHILSLTHAPWLQSRYNPLYATMILAWSTTEVIRYSFYAVSLVRGTVPGILVYLRYTTFYALYPIGASSEALLILSSLPVANPLQGLKDGSWSAWDYFRGVMFVIWWPGVYLSVAHRRMNTNSKLARAFCDDVAHDQTAEEGI